MFGQGAFFFTGNAPSTAGFITGVTANNGLSTTSPTNVVLGQEVDQAGDPAQLVSDREIPLGAFGGFSIRLTGDLSDAIVFSNTFISVNTSTFGTKDFLQFVAIDLSLAAVMGFASGPNRFRIQFGGLEAIAWETNGRTTLNFGAIMPEIVEAKTTAFAINTTIDRNKRFTNEGAGAGVVFTLPPAAAGLTYTFIVQDVDGITVDADAGDTIRIGSSVSTAGGTINSIVIGSVVKLVAINATEWIAESMLGTWTFT